ncbi:hypothetical protein ACWD9K_16075 [Streptomyces sp. 900116325]|uniref:hypothetical protein n=1 Tax=unclassified Streptomyces TaxID=2593676 RepID=UPI0033AC73FD
MRRRPRQRHAPVAGWAAPALGGWGATQWLAEPVATEGPGPARHPASGVGPGPRPKRGYDDACDGGATTTATPTPQPTAPAAPLLVVCVRSG